MGCLHTKQPPSSRQPALDDASSVANPIQKNDGADGEVDAQEENIMMRLGNPSREVVLATLRENNGHAGLTVMALSGRRGPMSESEKVAYGSAKDVAEKAAMGLNRVDATVNDKYRVDTIVYAPDGTCYDLGALQLTQHGWVTAVKKKLAAASGISAATQLLFRYETYSDEDNNDANDSCMGVELFDDGSNGSQLDKACKFRPLARNEDGATASTSAGSTGSVAPVARVRVLELCVLMKVPFVWSLYDPRAVTLANDDTLASFTAASSACTLCTTSVVLQVEGSVKSKWYWEVEVAEGSRRDGVYVGVCEPGLDLSTKHYLPTSTSGWFIYMGNGGLHGNGKQFSDKAGGYHHKDRVGVALDLSSGELQFFKNGQPHGPGWPPGSVTGPVVAAVQMNNCDNAVTLHEVHEAAWPKEV